VFSVLIVILILLIIVFLIVIFLLILIRFRVGGQLRTDDGGTSPGRDSRRLVGLKGNVRDSIVRQNRRESSRRFALVINTVLTT
jgi:hypothetical protein